MTEMSDRDHIQKRNINTMIGIELALRQGIAISLLEITDREINVTRYQQAFGMCGAGTLINSLKTIF